MTPWEDEIAEIIAKSADETLEQTRQRFKEASRAAPCRHGYALPPSCSLGYELHCLTCADYEPPETPGEIGMGMGFALFEDGSVVHLVRGVLTDGYYRCGKALCGRVLAEETMAVEIYPIDYAEELDELAKGELQAEGRDVCRKCHKEYFREDRRTRP